MLSRAEKILIAKACKARMIESLQPILDDLGDGEMPIGGMRDLVDNDAVAVFIETAIEPAANNALEMVVAYVEHGLLDKF
jgi:hypothetical protein